VPSGVEDIGHVRHGSSVEGGDDLVPFDLVGRGLEIESVVFEFVLEGLPVESAVFSLLSYGLYCGMTLLEERVSDLAERKASSFLSCCVGPRRWGKFADT
jgi:hypothetical protein